MAHCKSWYPLQRYKYTGRNTFWAFCRIIANMNSLNSIVTFKHTFPGLLKGFPSEGYYDDFKVILWMPLWFALCFWVFSNTKMTLFLHPRGIVEEQCIPLSASSFYCYYCKCIGLLIKKHFCKYIHVEIEINYIFTLYCVCVCVYIVYIHWTKL